MRAFSFDKEPTFRSMEATAIWGSLISAGASLVGGAMGASASKKAAKAQAAADKAALDFQKQQYEESKGYLQPYRDRGSRADASLDALYYGTSARPTAGPGSGGYLSGPSFDANTAALKLMYERGTPAYRAAVDWEAGRHGGDKIAAANAFIATQPGLQKSLESFKALAIKQNGIATGTDPSSKPITREDVMAQIDESPMGQYNAEDYAKREALNEADYLAAQGFTEDEIAAWVANAEAEQDKSLDAIFNRGGITGQVGSTRRGVAQVGEEFARDRAQYEAGRRRADYDPYARRRGANYDTFAAGRYAAFDDVTGYLKDESQRGYDATGRIISGGQGYADRASDITQGAGGRQAGYLSERANTWGNAIGNAGGYVAAGLSERAKRKNPSYSIPDSYGDYESVGGGYDDYTDAPTGYFNTRPKGGKSSNMYAGLY